MTTQDLLITNFTQENNGIYECQGINEMKQKFFAKVTLRVISESYDLKIGHS